MKNNEIKFAETLPQFEKFLLETIERSNFELTKINIADQNEWNLENGILSHKTGGFFHIAGLKDKISKEEHLVLYQPQNPITGLALCKANGTVYVLLQARTEPGAVCQYGPTIQATPANYLQLHGGKKNPYLEMFSGYQPNSNLISNSMQLDLGKRYYQKTKMHDYVEVSTFLLTEENMIWVPLKVIFESINNNNFLNADLRSLLSVFDWDFFIYNGDNFFYSNNNYKNDYSFLFKNIQKTKEWQLVSLNELKGWEVKGEGIVDLFGSGVSANMYNVSCTNREVKKWSQPLMCASNQGLVILLIRKVNDEYQVLISIQSEFGISYEQVILPSFIIYPGENKLDNPLSFDNGEIISEFIQSDEGGRFYQHESVYKVVLIDEEIKIESNQYWISANVLKNLLKSSNKASIQLRCIASSILDILNPNTFKRIKSKEIVD